MLTARQFRAVFEENSDASELLSEAHDNLESDVLKVESVTPAFFKHNHENERGQRIVTRSSAVYYFARRENFRTQLVFMNYWREKRTISVTMHLTLRTMAGEVLHRLEQPIEAIGGIVIELNDILDTIGNPVAEGSVELEFVSDQNMAIAYPAAIVRYLGEGWHTVAHASQRYYATTSGDDEAVVGAIQRAQEGNITIHEDQRLEPFLVIHNGPVEVPAHALEVEVLSATGRKLHATSEPIGWAPFETRLVWLRDLIDFRPFLAGERGTFSVEFLIGGIFPRLIGGNALGGEWSVDHTNFAATDGPAAADVIPFETRAGFKNLVFNLPNNIADHWECFADIYPTFPGEEYHIGVRLLDEAGKVLDEHDVDISRSEGKLFPRIVVDNDLVESTGGNVELLFNHARELPRRFHTGIHYRVGGGNPGFLTDGPIPHSTAPISTRWFPAFEPTESQNFLLIANRHAGDEAPSPVRYAMRLFNSFGDEPKHAVLELGACESRSVDLAELFEGYAEFLGDRPGWVYMSADRPQRSVLHYASVRGGRSVAVCHAF